MQSYTGVGTVGLDAKAPVRSQFRLVNPTSNEYSKATTEFIEPGGEGSRFATGNWNSEALMPLKDFGGGDPNSYAYETEPPPDVS
jgi:hypothetical protein